MTAFHFPWETPAAAPALAIEAPTPDGTEKARRGRPRVRERAAVMPRHGGADTSDPHRPATGEGRDGDAASIHHTAWLSCVVTIAGPEASVKAFVTAAAGAGVTPWQRDFAAEEEFLFAQLASRYPRTGRLSLDGCRVFAAQFRERLQDHHHRALATVGWSTACPFDLHALLPVPNSLLSLGREHPDAARWLATRWGTTEIRRAVVLPAASKIRRKRAGHAAARRFGFFAADMAPRAAVRQLAEAWPDLRVELRTVDTPR